MATSGSISTTIEIVELVDEAFERVGIDPENLTARHTKSARRSIDLIFSDWQNEGVFLWNLSTSSSALVDGTEVYALSAGIISLFDVYVRRNGLDTPVEPMTLDEYSAIPDKDTEGLPTRYYFGRGVDTSNVTLWPVPENSTDVLYYTYMQQFVDAGRPANNPDIPHRWWEALASALAARLAEKYNPERFASLSATAARMFQRAKIEDRQRAPTKMRLRF